MEVVRIGWYRATDKGLQKAKKMEPGTAWIRDGIQPAEDLKDGKRRL